MNDFTDGRLFLYEKLKLYKEVISCYMQNHDDEGLITCCKRLGDSGSGGDPSLWADLLKYFGELGEDCSKEVKEVLTYIERNDILPPIVVLQTLSQNPCLTLSVIKDYFARKLERESKRIEEDIQAIEKYQGFGGDEQGPAAGAAGFLHLDSTGSVIWLNLVGGSDSVAILLGCD
ncbi:Vacuolar protein-sorting-associated protein 11-like protein [Drosera capensis]